MPMPDSGAPRSARFSTEQLLQLLVGSVTDYAIYTMDRDGFVTTWNSGAERIKGYRRDEILGQHFSRFFTLEDQAAAVPLKALEQARNRGSFSSEGWRVRKTGSRFWASVVLQALRDPDGELIGFAKITRDITERMEAHNALKESERRFRLLVQGVIDYAIFMLDPSGIIVNWNAGAERMKGYKEWEIVGQHFSRFYTAGDRAAGLPARVIETATREGRFEAEGWRVRKDGSRFWASIVIDAIRDEAGELMGFAKITRDITERQQAQEALQDSERQFRLLVAGVVDYAIYMLDPNGLITSWNAGAERIKGYGADEILGQHFSKFYTEQDRASGLPARALQIASTTGRFEAENWRVRKDGTLFWANVIIDAIRDEKGELIGFAKITRDMTEKRNTQMALEQAQLRRAQTQKFEALGQLTSGVAHDFNNLLMIVSGHLMTLKAIAGGDPKGLRAVEAIGIASKRGQALTRQLLSFARRQALNPVETRLQEHVSAARDLMAASTGRSVEIREVIPSDIWPVKVDVNELELALVNLAVNARDAMPEGGLVTVAAENVTLDGKALADTLEGEFVALTIADTGCGIPPDILPRIFEPFFTTKPGEKGTGLGLAQVHGFAHQSGGGLSVESELGRGTRVTLYLPRATEQGAADSPSGDVQQISGTPTVLLVEDNPEVAEASSSMLTQLGYQVRVATTPEAALAAADEKDFDLVVSDIVMAGNMNGLELARRLKANRPNQPIVLVTGYSDVGETASKEFTVLRKPYDAAEIGQVLAGLLQRKQHAKSGKLVDFKAARAERTRDRH